jgi:uncharacterized protein YjbI with pentapeptide repeats
LSRHSIALVLAVAFFPMALAMAAEQQARNEPKPLSLAELKSAVSRGDRIVNRLIEGADLTSVLESFISEEEKCAPKKAVQIEKSTIRGQISIKDKSAKDSDDTDPAGPNYAAVRRDQLNWLSVPVTIKDSIASGELSIKLVGLACKLDLSGSVFEESNNFHLVTFAEELVGEKATFKDATIFAGCKFEAAVRFRKAKFLGNLQFLREHGSAPTFDEEVDFREAIFGRLASFLGASFRGNMDFRYADFQSAGSFSGSKLGSSPSITGPFYMAEFRGLGNFRNTRFGSLALSRLVFRNGVDFHRANGKSLRIWGASVSGPFSFDDAHIERLDFQGFGWSMIVNGEAIFRRGVFDTIKFKEVSFKKIVDFDEVTVRSQMVLDSVSFDGDLRFEDVSLSDTKRSPDGEPESEEGTKDEATKDEVTKDQATKEVKTAKPAKTATVAKAKKNARAATEEFSISDITLNSGFHTSSDQFFAERPWWAFWREDQPRFVLKEKHGAQEQDNRRILRELGRAFELAKNVELKNFVDFRLRETQEASEDFPQRISSKAARWFWGYGVRPMRVLFWLAVLVLAFAATYWTQLPAGSNTNCLARNFSRVRSAVTFSARTAWEVSYGYNNSTTTTFRLITIAESILAKLLFACLAYALTKSSPLLSELLKKLIP